MRTHGNLLISLDFELFWGVFDIYEYPNKNYFDNTLSIIPKLLDLFEKYKIHVTWASVGMLFNENKEEWLNNQPKIKPLYQNSKLDAYEHGKKNINKSNEKYYFAPNLIKQIIETPYQELASHTYSHYYCLEKGQTNESFDEDLNLAIKLFRKYNTYPESLIFPRNQYNSKYNNICKKYKIKNLRINPNNWYWKSSSLKSKGFRFIDSYLNIDNKSYKKENVMYDNEIYFQPASRFLRPITNNSILNNLRDNRVFKEMEYSAKNNLVYHLWFHPHNFGHFPKRSLKAFEKFLIKYKELNSEYNFSSISMRDFSLD